MKKLEGNIINKYFWYFQITLWVCLYAVFALYDYKYIDQYTTYQIFVADFFTYLGGFIGTTFLHFYFRYIPITYDFSYGIRVFLLVQVANLLWHIIDMLLTRIFLGWEPGSFSTNVMLYFRTLFMTGGWMAFYIGFRSLSQLWKEQQKNEELLLSEKTAQYNLLRYQLNPHFLFNALNSVRGLIYKSPEDADTMISRLSDFMRYSLTNTDRKEVPLEEELEVIKSYLNIEKLRFGDRLQISVNIDQIALEYPIPPYLIIPLTENAVKYGMKTSSMPLRIDIAAEVKDDALHITVANSGYWYVHKNGNGKADIGTGTGLENVRGRLMNMYPTNHEFSIEKKNGSVAVHICLQKELAYEEE